VPRIELREITTDAGWDAVMGLRLGPGQDAHLNSMPDIREESIEDARGMPHPWAVHDADTGELVGFVMISDDVPAPIPDDMIGPYFLWKLLIDHPRQGQGYGRATLDAVVAYVAGRPNATVLPTSCADGPHSPRDFYLGHGLPDTGRVMWGENVLALDLATRRTAGTP